MFPVAVRSASRHRSPGEGHRPVPFPSVVCGVGPGIPSLHAARQAATIATGGRLTLAAIGTPDGVGPEWAELAAAFVLAARDGKPPDVLEIPTDRVLPSLVRLAARHDLLTIGVHDTGSGREDITDAIVRQSPVPVLLARAVPSGADVADRILAVRAERADPAAAVVTALADGPGSTVETVTIPVAATRAARNGAAQTVLDATRRFGPTLVVISSRGLGAAARRESVSAMVAAAARCSVLVVRGFGSPCAAKPGSPSRGA